LRFKQVFNIVSVFVVHCALQIIGFTQCYNGV
jgi:hypothetical protein